MTTEPKEGAEMEREKADADEPWAPAPFLVSFVTMLAVFAAAELFYRDSAVDLKLRKGYNYITAKRIDYETMGGDIVVTGDSRMYHALSPAVMTETLQALKGTRYEMFNYGIPSGTTPIFLMVAHDAATHKPPPRVFILGVTPALFSCCDAVSAAGTQPGVIWSAVPLFLRAGWYAAPDEAASSVFYGASRMMAFRTEISTVSHELNIAPPITFHNRGWYSMGGRINPATQDVRAKGRAGAYAELMDKSKGCELHTMPGRYLAEAIDDLKRHGVKVIVMGTPQARQLDWYHDEKHTYFEYIAEVKRVTSEHGVPFIDMNAPPGIESTDFMDGDHLSEPGTTIFTKYVATEIVAPLLP
jgi:hypothetical protein